MSLEDVIKETKEKLEEAVKAEQAALGVEEKLVDEVKDDPAPEIKEEKISEEEKLPEEEKRKTPAEYAAERRADKARANAEVIRERDEANARAASLAAENATLKAKPKVAEPDRSEDPAGWAEWKINSVEKETLTDLKELKTWKDEREKERATTVLRDAAIKEIENYESQVRGQNQDYDDVKRYYANMLATSIKIVNPKITNDALVQRVNDRLISRAAELLNDGHENPLKAMYDEAKNLGYQKVESKEIEEKNVKPDLSKVASNRARNAGTAAANGNGGSAEITPKVASEMTNAEFARLKPAEKERLFKQLGAAR